VKHNGMTTRRVAQPFSLLALAYLHPQNAHVHDKIRQQLRLAAGRRPSFVTAGRRYGGTRGTGRRKKDGSGTWERYSLPHRRAETACPPHFSLAILVLVWYMTLCA